MHLQVWVFDSAFDRNYLIPGDGKAMGSAIFGTAMLMFVANTTVANHATADLGTVFVKSSERNEEHALLNLLNVNFTNNTAAEVSTWRTAVRDAVCFS